MKKVLHKDFVAYEKEIENCIKDFGSKGKVIYGGSRNTIKTYDLGNIVLNVKGFKVPNLVNQFAYKFIRKSKAERSYNYAKRLLSVGIGTPIPIAFFEYSTPISLQESFYVSEHLAYDLTYRNLVRQDVSIENWEGILRAFTSFTFKLHEAGIEFLDHSPGNTLIKLNNGDYKFYLVDLNRMNFKQLSLDERIKNFAKLTPRKDMVAIMSSEYAQLYKGNEKDIFEKMWDETTKFQEKFRRKRKLKKKLKFWKK